MLVVAVGAALVLWPEGERNDRTSRDLPPLPSARVAQFPSPPVAATHQAAGRDHDPVAAGGEEEFPALCDGCLTERAVLDVVETYLRHLDPVYLQGDIWAHPLADIAPDTPGLVHGQPPLPPELLEVPEFNPFGTTVDSRDYPVETTWIVWIQTGWVPRKAIEQRIRRTRERTIAEMRANEPLNFDALQTASEEAAPGTVLPDDHIIRTSSGDLPEVALSWPPIKKQVFVAVDSRNGDLRPDGIFIRTSIGLHPPHPSHYDAVLDATRERASRWFRGGGAELGSS